MTILNMYLSIGFVMGVLPLAIRHRTKQPFHLALLAWPLMMLLWPYCIWRIVHPTVEEIRRFREKL